MLASRLRIAALRIVLCAISAPGGAWQRDQSTSPLAVGAVIPFVHVRIDVKAANGPFYVPICGEGQFGTPVLCGSATRLEVRTKVGWQPVHQRLTFGVLGGENLDRLRGRQIESDVQLLFQFSRRWFAVEPGQVLRVVLDVWRDEQSFRDRGQPTHLASPPFSCPLTGTGR